MSSIKILMSNLGYLRGISGTLSHHFMYAHRHVYCSAETQKKYLKQLSTLIELESPDICCFVEIDKGSGNSGSVNQLEALVNDVYPFFDIENKYAKTSRLRRFTFTKGKSNGFLAKKEMPFEKIYFSHGKKRLIYRIEIAKNVTLFFTHFSLKQSIRAQQLLHIKRIVNETKGESIILGDFNILTGFNELAPLLHNNEFVLLNNNEPTFTFHRSKKVLDLCICSSSLAPKTNLKIIPQSFSDHAALLVEIDT
jgi:endonuclease/exonuclease/phosphatase family metal-dependent hydrolase